jgi:hypothetical protein
VGDPSSAARASGCLQGLPDRERKARPWPTCSSTWETEAGTSAIVLVRPALCPSLSSRQPPLSVASSLEEETAEQREERLTEEEEEEEEDQDQRLWTSYKEGEKNKDV